MLCCRFRDQSLVLVNACGQSALAEDLELSVRGNRDVLRRQRIKELVAPLKALVHVALEVQKDPEESFLEPPDSLLGLCLAEVRGLMGVNDEHRVERCLAMGC